MENTDLVSEFFDREPTQAEMPVAEAMSGADQFENVGDEIESILSKLGLSSGDSGYAFMSMKDSFDKLTLNDSGIREDPPSLRSDFTAEVADVLSFVASDKSDDELAAITDEIVTTVIDQRPLDLSDLDMSSGMGEEEAKIESEIESSMPEVSDDIDTENDLDPTFWD